jgi:hypothetical protein
LGVLVASLLLAGIAVAAPSSYDIDWWAMASGSGSGTDGSTSLEGTLGQATLGVDRREHYIVCTGFWYGTAQCPVALYLPIIRREFVEQLP